MHRLGPSEPPPDVFAPLLERLRLESSDLFGPGAHLVPLAYQARPFSHVLRLEVRSDGAAPSLRAYAKVFKPKPAPDGVEVVRRRVRHEFEATRSVHGGLARHERLDVVRPIACYPDLLAFVTEEVAGETLGAFLHRRASWFPGDAAWADLDRAMARIGAWLQAFQGTAPAGDVIQISSVRDYVDNRLQRLVAHGGGLIDAAMRERLLLHIEHLGAAIPAEQRREVPVHADFAPGNVMVAGDRVVVLDFAMMGRGTRLQDLTRLWMQMDLLTVKWRYRPAVVARLQRMLLQGFDGALTPDDPLFRLQTLLHRVNHLGTMTLKPGSWLRQTLDRDRRRQHERWIRAELARGNS